MSLIPVLLGLIAAQPRTLEQSVSRLIVQDELVLRIPVAPHPMGPPIVWEERKGPKCIPIAAIRAAMLSNDPQQVDFILINRARVRARLDEDCPGLDFYGGFYLQTGGDRLCAGHDAIYSRMGGSCTINRFKLLEARIAR